jgi:hypothetical protein
MRTMAWVALAFVGSLAAAASAAISGCGSSCDPAVNCVPMDAYDAAPADATDSAAPVDAGRG